MRKKPMTPQVRHATHEVIIRAGRGPHPGELYCKKCRKHVQWVSQQQYQQLLKDK